MRAHGEGRWSPGIPGFLDVRKLIRWAVTGDNHGLESLEPRVKATAQEPQRPTLVISLPFVLKWKNQVYGRKWGATSKEVWNKADPTMKGEGYGRDTPESWGAALCWSWGPWAFTSFHFILFGFVLFWLASWCLNMPILSSLLTSPQSVCILLFLLELPRQMIPRHTWRLSYWLIWRGLKSIFFNLNYLADLWPDVQLQICSPGFWVTC